MFKYLFLIKKVLLILKNDITVPVLKSISTSGTFYGLRIIIIIIRETGGIYGKFSTKVWIKTSRTS